VIDASAPTTDLSADRTQASERYLLLADISGYTSFLKGVEVAHGVDLSGGIPAGYEILGELLDAVSQGVQALFEIVKLEGDAVFAVASAEKLDGDGSAVLDRMRATYASFVATREEAKGSSDHVCTACPVVANLDLKVILHRGMTVKVQTGRHAELHGPAVNVAHRLLKNTVQMHFGQRAYVFVTNAAAAGLGLETAGLRHHEDYPDVGVVEGSVIGLA
jgi:hypothetical protein